MPYATLDDVRNLAPQIPISATSKPSDAQVDGFIASLERIVNASLANLGYVVPVTADESVAILRDMVSQGALARTLRARAIGTRNPADDQGAADAQKEFDTRLKALGSSRDPFELPDAERTDAISKDRADMTRVGGNTGHVRPRFCPDMEF
jgi:hypothetical protein